MSWIQCIGFHGTQDSTQELCDFYVKDIKVTQQVSFTTIAPAALWAGTCGQAIVLFAYLWSHSFNVTAPMVNSNFVGHAGIKFLAVRPGLHFPFECAYGCSPGGYPGGAVRGFNIQRRKQYKRVLPID